MGAKGRNEGDPSHKLSGVPMFHAMNVSMNSVLDSDDFAILCAALTSLSSCMRSMSSCMEAESTSPRDEHIERRSKRKLAKIIFSFFLLSLSLSDTLRLHYEIRSTGHASLVSPFEQLSTHRCSSVMSAGVFSPGIDDVIDSSDWFIDISDCVCKIFFFLFF